MKLKILGSVSTLALAAISTSVLASPIVNEQEKATWNDPNLYMQYKECQKLFPINGLNHNSQCDIYKRLDSKKSSMINKQTETNDVDLFDDFNNASVISLDPNNELLVLEPPPPPEPGADDIPGDLIKWKCWFRCGGPKDKGN